MAGASPPLPVRELRPPDHVATCRQIVEVGDRLAHLLTSPGAAAARAPGLSWTVQDLVAHLVVQADSFTAFASGQRDPEADFPAGADGLPVPERVALVNARLIREAAVESSDAAAQSLRRAAAALAQTFGEAPPTALFRSWEGTTDIRTGAATYLAELLVHGRDVAGALDRPWPIRDDEARAAIHAVLRLLPDYLDPAAAAGVDALIRLRVRGGPDIVLRVRDGEAAVRAADRRARPDCTVAVTPRALLLLSFRRSPLVDVVRRGQVVSWGRRPALAWQMLSWFRAP